MTLTQSTLTKVERGQTVKVLDHPQGPLQGLVKRVPKGKRFFWLQPEGATHVVMVMYGDGVVPL